MPTTIKEAEAIVDIVKSTIINSVSEYSTDIRGVQLNVYQIRNQIYDPFVFSNTLSQTIFANLAELAYQTENYSLRSSLFMVCRVLNPDWRPDYTQLCKLVEVYDDLQPEMSYQEFLGLTNEEFIEFTEGCQI